MDVNCGTLPSPPTSLCPPYPSMFHHPPSPSDLGFYSAAAAHHSAFPFMAAAAASSVAGSQLNPVVSQPSQMSNTLGKSFLTASFIQTFVAFFKGPFTNYRIVASTNTSRLVTCLG